MTLTVLLFWSYFLLLKLVFVLQWLSFHYGILIIVVSQFPLTFRQTQIGVVCFIFIPYDCSCADWDSLRVYLRDVPWGDIFKLGASAAGGEFLERVYRLELMCISCIVNIRSSHIHLHGFRLLLLP